MEFPPPDSRRVGWVSESYHDRGTASLLFNCLVTFFICTWSAVHLNVAADGDTGFIIKIRKIKWMIITILAPEYVATSAFRDWRYARSWMDDLETWSEDQKSNGGTAQIAHIQSDFNFSIDGYYDHCRRMQIHRYWPKIAAPWTMTHAFFIEMGGLSAEFPDGERFRILRYTFRRLMRNGMILPFISEEEIQDKSKASWAVKALTCIQISWFVAQVIGRSVQKLLITPLELFTLAIVLCTLVSYILWWKKPLDVDKPIIIKLDGVSCAMIEDYNPPGLQDIDYVASLRQRNLHVYSMFHLDRVCFMIAIALAFGACHLIAWNWSFPSLAEKWLWRLASIGCALFPAIFGLMLALRAHMANRNLVEADATRTARGIIYSSKTAQWIRLDYFLGAFYVICRLYLVVEIFASLRSMPTGVYASLRWLEYLPHF